MTVPAHRFVPHPALPPRTAVCPHCNVSSQMLPLDIRLGGVDTGEVKVIRCASCNKLQVYCENKMVYPETLPVSHPNSDLDGEIQKDFLEAAGILQKSPRGAAALLRLCIQKLCVQLGEKGENINDDITALVSKGLDPRVQMALDIVRVVGNDAVHPGTIDLNDTPQVAKELFSLVNMIADIMITQPNNIKAMYDALPETKRDGIEARNKKALGTS